MEVYRKKNGTHEQKVSSCRASFVFVHLRFRACVMVGLSIIG